VSLTETDVKKIARLARLSLDEQDISAYTQQLSSILDFVSEMSAVDTSEVPPLAHPLDLAARLRADVITETDQRETFQAIAPRVEANLYLVPKVIDT
jgi:aspartyl-tRNA(Asn)/glutamyl-tRNA(Gln) amidotransferase subunit C